MFPILHIAVLRQDVTLLIHILDAAPWTKYWVDTSFSCPADFECKVNSEDYESLNIFSPLGLCEMIALISYKSPKIWHVVFVVACLLGYDNCLRVLLSRYAIYLSGIQYNYRNRRSASDGCRCEVVGLLSCCVIGNSACCLDLIASSMARDHFVSLCCSPGIKYIFKYYALNSYFSSCRQYGI